MKKILLLLSLAFGFNINCFAANNATDIYVLAHADNTSELKKVDNIDVVDADGNTALCSAIKYNDIKSYNILKSMGANTEHKCIKNIPTEQYQTFIQKVATASKPWSFLGLGKWAWTAIGAGVVAGGAAASMGGGSGGGNSNTVSNNNTGNNDNNGGQQNQSCESQGYTYEYTDVCPTGWQLGTSCTSGTTTKYKCNQPVSCPSNYTVSCSFGYIPTANTCQSGDEIYVECVFDTENYLEQDGQIYSKLNCGNGTQTGNTCICSYGYVFNNNTCIFDDMNYIEQGGQIYLKLYCDDGIQIGNACVNNSEIVIDNVSSTSTSAVYGMYSGYNRNITNADSGIINIKNTYKSYGMQTYGSDSVALNEGKIYIDDTDLSYSVNADAYGISVSNGASGINADTGEIKITNAGPSIHYFIGMYAYSAILTNDGIISIENISGTHIAGMQIYSYANSDEITAVNNGTISLKDTTSAKGITGYDYDFRDLYITNNGTITIENSESATGIGASNAIITNNDMITIENSESATGISASNAIVTNNGDIIIDNSSIDNSSNVYGIYAYDSIVTNTGTIVITNAYVSRTYGIFATGSSTVVRNTGTISINGSSCTGNACNNNSRYIYLKDGATFENSGLMMAPQMNLNSMGGKVVAGLGSQFVVDNELSGDLNISSEIVQNGNQTTYIAQNMIDAGDVSGLNIRSGSAMFNATLADNGHDVVMTMRDFNELTDNKSLAAFLGRNYANGNGAELFSTLKSMDNMSAFNSTLSGLTGLNTFTQFAHEDLSAMREISFSMNNKLFENSNRDSFDISDSMGYFSFSNDHNGGSGRYGISSDKIGDNWKLGYGMAMANIYTGDGDSMHRQNNLWLFYMPATYTHNNYELVVAPKAGFAHSEYSRRGYNNQDYQGYIEKRIFGVMNDLRYPFGFGNWTIAPDFAFNTIVYDQSGHENGQEFSLVIPEDRTVSVETGLGLYAKYENILSNGGRLKLNSGVMAYREFGDTYDIKLGMRGMDGTFSLYNNDYKYRGAASVGFDYAVGRLHMYGNAQYFMDNDNYMNFKSGISYRF